MMEMTNPFLFKGLGVDIQDVAPFQKYTLDYSTRFWFRVFAKDEFEECLQKKNPYPSLVARFCAKEAYVKALSDANLRYGFIHHPLLTDVYISTEQNVPRLRSRNDTSKTLQEFFQKNDIFVSLSHTELYACAQVMIFSKQVGM